MQIHNFHRKNTGLFSEHQLRLVYDQSYYDEFIQTAFSKEAILDQIRLKEKRFNTEKRNILVNALKAQYTNVDASTQTLSNIEALSYSNTYTITTGHQLSLFTGPLYFVVKILHVIKMTEELKEVHPENTFVPVYWMATEDHDFEEIQSAHLFNQTITWESDQKGPVGLFDLEGFDEVKQQMHDLFGNKPEAEIHEVLKSYSGENLTEATRNLVNALFKSYGLVIIDGDDQLLKNEFAGIMQDDIVSNFAFDLVNQQTQKLVEAGGKAQVTPREINLFYIEKGTRNRLKLESDQVIVDNKGTFDKSEAVTWDAVNLSPNVILRPLYQETILPNLAYIGGGGELSYWLQLKGVFDQVEEVFPLIQVRNSIIWMDRGVSGKLQKNGFELSSIFNDRDQWKRSYVEEHSADELDFTQLENHVQELMDEMKRLILEVDSTKSQYAESESARLNKQINAIKDKLVKSSKSKHEQAMKAIDLIKDKLFPGGGLQERKTNFFHFCADGEVYSHIADLHEAMNPFSGDLILLQED